MQRRSSSAYTQRTSLASRNSLPASLLPAKGHRSLERKKATGLKYSGSQSTSNIPRRIVKENAEKMRSVNMTLSSGPEKSGKDLGPDSPGGGSGGPVTSILSFVEDFPRDLRKETLIHGQEGDHVRAEDTGPSGPTIESKNNAKNENIKKAAGKKKEETKAVGGKRNVPTPAQSQTAVKTNKTEKRLVRPAGQSATAPVRTPATARTVKATKSLTAPVSPATTNQQANKNKVTKTASAPKTVSKTSSVSSSTPAQAKPLTGKGKKNFPPKKVSSEYPNEILFKNQEGLKFSSVNFFEEEEGATSR